MIQVEGLTKRYPRHTAVEDIHFEVEKGQIVGFLGPNGAGKTTTMRMLTGYLPPSAGTAKVAGFDVLDQPKEVKRRVGYLPENPPVYPDMTVSEYLHFAGQLKGIASSSIARSTDVAIDRCNLGDVRHKLIHQLSKGYRQRVGLAQAIIHNPEVLILDEPTSGLDPRQIIEVRDLIRSLGGDHTVILSTHILPEVESTCESVVIISRGRLVARDSVENLTHRLRGEERILVSVRGGNAENLQELLLRVPGVLAVQPAEARPELSSFEVQSSAGVNPRSEIARAVVGAGMALESLQTAAQSLESVFLQLTGATADAPPAAAKGENQ
jgi:ABC-2 type transport system ATP-binding protein